MHPALTSALTVIALLLQWVAPAARSAEERFLNLAAQRLLPEGPGLANPFPADAGVSAHPAVVFADDFETGALEGRWDATGAAGGRALR